MIVATDDADRLTQMQVIEQPTVVSKHAKP
jgi:hypothetical protein